MIGGGVTAGFAASALAARGVDVVLVEPAQTPRRAVPAALDPLPGPGLPGTLSALARESFALHARAGEELGTAGEPARARPTARVRLALAPSEVPALERTHEFAAEHEGLAAHWLEREALLGLEPRLHAAVVGGLLTEGVATVDAGAYARALREGARRGGARTVRGEVGGWRHDGTSVTAAVLEQGRIACGAVVLATVTGPLGRALPVEAGRDELLRARVDGPAFTQDLLWDDVELTALRGGEVWLGASEARTGRDPVPSQAGSATILERARRMLPAVVDARILDRVVGPRPVTPDGLPICGPVPGWDNVVVAVGAGRRGTLLGAGLGGAAADLVTTGRTGLSVAALGPERFGTPRDAAEAGPRTSAGPHRLEPARPREWSRDRGERV